MKQIESALKSLVDTSTRLDAMFGYDSGMRDSCNYEFVSKDDWEILLTDSEAVVVFKSENFEVMYSPNFNCSPILNKTYRSY